MISSSSSNVTGIECHTVGTYNISKAAKCAIIVGEYVESSRYCANNPITVLYPGQSWRGASSGSRDGTTAATLSSNGLTLTIDQLSADSDDSTHSNHKVYALFIH